MPAESSYGLWWDPQSPDRKVAGRLSWDRLGAPELELLDPTTPMWAGEQLVDGVYNFGTQWVPMLHGRLADKGAVTLLGCGYGGAKFGVTEVQKLRVGRALIGVLLEEPEERFIRRAELHMPALAQLLGDYPVRPSKWPTRRTRKVQVDLEDRKLEWQSGDVEATVLYKFTGRQSTTSTSFEMIPTLELTSSTPKSLGYWLSEWVAPTNTLIETATGTKSSPASIHVWWKKNLSPLERAGGRIPVWMAGVGDHDHSYERELILMSAAAINLNPGGLPDVLGRMRTLADEQEVFLDLLTATINSVDRPIRNRYVDLTSALEAFHSRRYGVSSISKEDFASRRSDALDAVALAGTEAAHQKFLKKWVPRRPSTSLEARLRRLAKDVDVLGSWTVPPGRMAQLRNDIAHGNALVGGTELRTAFDQAFNLSRRLVLHEIGIRNKT